MAASLLLSSRRCFACELEGDDGHSWKFALRFDQAAVRYHRNSSRKRR